MSLPQPPPLIESINRRPTQKRTNEEESLLVICTAEITCISSYSYLNNYQHAKKQKQKKKKIPEKHTQHTYILMHIHIKQTTQKVSFNE